MPAFRFSRQFLLAAFAVMLSGCGSSRQPHKGVLGLPRPAVGAIDFVIDGMSGAVDTVPSFRSGQTVRVVVRNVNPFLYSYSIGTENEQAVEEPSPLAFFNIAFHALGVTFPAPDQTKTVKSFFVGPADPCEGIAKPLATAGLEVTAFNKLLQSLTLSAYTQRTAFERALREARVPGSDMVAVRVAADEASMFLRQFAESAGESARALAQSLDRLSKALEDGQVAVQKIPAGSCADLQKEIENLAAVVKGAGQNVDKVRAVHLGAEAAYVSFNATVKDSASYYAVRMLKRYDAPTHLTVTVARRPVVMRTFADVLQPLQGRSDGGSGGTTTNPPPPTVSNTITVTVPPAQNAAVQGDGGAKTGSGGSGQADPSTLFATHRLTLGGLGRFSIAAGVLVSGLHDPRFAATQKRISPVPGQSTDTSEYILTLSDSGRFRVVPTVALNVLVADFGGLRDGIHVTLGTGVQKPGTDPTFGWYGGLAISGFESRLMLTGGFYGAQVRQLADMRLGQRLPTASVPNHSGMRAAWALGVLFRIY